VIFLVLKDDEFIEHGRSEIVHKSSNPKYIKNFKINYKVDSQQQLRFEV